MGEPTLMVVGAGAGQLPAIARARELGLRVVAIDRDPGAVGMAHADVALALDVVDREGAVRAARQHGVTGVLTMQSDLTVPTVGAVVDALGLAGSGLAVAERCSNKIEARERFREAGVPQPAFEVAGDEASARVAADRVGYPCVVKAPDSSGSRGVVKVERPDEVTAAFAEAAAHSREGRVLVEGYVTGVEIGAQGFSLDGTCAQVWVHDDVVSAPPYMVPQGHVYPCELTAPVLAGVQGAVARCVDALGVQHGPSNIDLILQEDGTPMVLEVGARIGATCLPELTSYHTGIDWVEAAIRAALGETPDLAPGPLRPVAALILEAPADGRLVSWDFPEASRAEPRLVEWEVTAAPGDAVQRLRKGTDRIGKVVATGASAPDALEAAWVLRRSCTFEVAPAEGGDRA